MFTCLLSPCIVADDANIEVAARRIMWGKCVNVGQSCIAPDYIVCSRSTQERLVEAFKRTLAEFYGEVCKCLYRCYMCFNIV